MSKKILPLALALALVLSACESTQSSNMTMKLNGVPLNNYETGVSSGSGFVNPCIANPTICIAAGIALGGLGFAIYNNHNDDEQQPNCAARAPNGAVACLGCCPN